MLVRERITFLRKQKGINTTEMGKMLNVSQGTISRYENGTVKNIPYNKLKLIASIFGCSIGELIKEDPAYDFYYNTTDEESSESIVVTNKDDIAMLNWFHSLPSQERSFFKKLFNSGNDNAEVMLIQLHK